MEKYLIYDFNDDYGREPIIRKAKNGTLICIFLTGGTWEPQNKNVVKIMKSYDDGKTWTKPTILFSHHSRGVWSPEMFLNNDKIILMIIVILIREHIYNYLKVKMVLIGLRK